MTEPLSIQKPVSGPAVTVGCKLPNGLTLELNKYGQKDYQRITLRGAQSSRIVGGFGLTEVSADFMNAWLKKNAALSYVEQGLIFVHSTATNAEAHARDMAAQPTGFERLSPKDAPKGLEVDLEHMKAGQRDLSRFKQAAA